MKTPVVIAAAIAVCAGAMLSPALYAQHAAARPAAVQPCPPAQTAAHCVRGTLIIWEDPAHPSLNQMVQEDNSGAPQFSIGVGGATSWANPFCVTDNPRYSRLGFVACFGGRAGGDGQGDPLMVLYEERGGQLTGRSASLDYRQLRFLDRWLAARGIR